MAAVCLARDVARHPAVLPFLPCVPRDAPKQATQKATETRHRALLDPAGHPRVKPDAARMAFPFAAKSKGRKVSRGSVESSLLSETPEQSRVERRSLVL